MMQSGAGNFLLTNIWFWSLSKQNRATATSFIQANFTNPERLINLMTAKVITYLNEKGGVGKTTTVAATACQLAYMGYNVCIIDTDTQGHVAVRLKREPEDGFYALMQGRSWRDVLRPIEQSYYGGKTEQPLLWIVPSAAATRELDNNLNARALIKRLDEVRQAFDFILFDTSPRLGAIHAALFAASDFILIPSECTTLSVRGVIST